MALTRARIESLAGVEPPLVITSDEIEHRLAPLYQRLSLPTGRLELMTGIRERRFWDGPMSASAASALAGEQALAASAVPRERIDLLLHCAVCRDRLEPATAAAVHAALGLPARAQFFDVSNACLGFLNGVLLAAGLIESGQIRAALVCSGENGRSLLERTIEILLTEPLNRKAIKPYFANLTIGSGAAAAVIADRDLVPAARLAISGYAAAVDSAASVLCQGDNTSGSLEMLTEAEALLDAGVALAGRTWQAFCANTGWDAATPDRFITHQVGRMHQLRLFSELGLDTDRDFITYPRLGNVGSVSLPITLHQAVAAGAFGPGQRAALLGIGSGLSCLMAGIEFND
jgi:3-oxoacyl-[acyl-carrier-protein] synthase-3